MRLQKLLGLFPATCVDDLFEMYLLGCIDDGRSLPEINHLRVKGLSPRQIMLCLVLTRGPE